MFRNYLATAIRNLVRNRLYGAINITGLTVGFAAALLIGLFVRDEFSYDTWMRDHERIFMITETMYTPGRSPFESHQVPAELAELMKLDFPEIETIARVAEGASAALRRGDIEANETIYWADPEIFDVLSLSSVVGDLKTALSHPDGIVLTRRMATKYFGAENPIGATIELNREHAMTVHAVIEDLPPNTHLTTDIFASGLAAQSFMAHRKANPGSRGDWVTGSFTYLKLAPGASSEKFESSLPAFLERHFEVGRVSLWVTPVSSVHLQPDNSSNAMKPASNPSTARALAGVGVLLLLIASINFVNLMTARATRRAIEVGVRKVTGAARMQLVLQFVGESILYAVAAALAAVMLVEALLPSFNAFLDRSISLAYADDLLLSGGVAGMVVVVGALAGFYPAFVLSSYRPTAVLKTALSLHSGTDRVRKVLVALQFAILIGLIVGVSAIYRQSSFALNEGLRVNKDQVLIVATNCSNTFPERVRALPGVRAAACAERSGLNFGSSNFPVNRAGGEPLNIARYPVDFGFLELYGLKPLAGRFFDREHGSEARPLFSASANGPAIVINQTAARRLGFASPEEAVGLSISPALPPGILPDGISNPAFRIIGVVPDFSLDSIHSLVSPSLYYVDPETFQWLSIKLTGDRLPETLQAIDALWKEAGDPRPITRLFLDQEIQKVYLDIQRQSALFAAFAGIAVLTACLGLFGLSAFTAEQRTKEIGIRKSMGATRRDILRLILWQFAKPVLWANLIAWPIAYFVMQRWLEGFAYHIDLAPWTFIGASALALSIAIITVLGHALLVARAQPIAALRYE